MLRKDLKPGSLFRYANQDGSHSAVHCVPPKEMAQMGLIGANEVCIMSTNPELDRETVLFAEPKQEAANAASPAHYTATEVEPIDAIEAWGLGFRLANVIKYVARAGKKPGVDAGDDLRKARAYLSREIAALEGRRSWE